MKITAKTAVFALRYFFVVAVSIAGKSLRDTYFLSRYDRTMLPLMFVACAAGVALASTSYSSLSRRLSRRSLLDILSAASIAGLLMTQLHLEGWVVAFLYVWVEVIVALTLLQFWLQSADSFDPREAKRVFGLIGAGGSVAAIVVGTSLKPIARILGQGLLMWMVAASLAASWFLGRYAFRYIRKRPALSKKAGESPSHRRFDKYLLLIAIVSGLTALVGQLVDYQFKMVAARSFSTEADLVGFFGQFYASTGLASLIVQFLVTGLVLSRFGILAGLLTLPLLLNVGMLAMLLRPSLLSAVIGKFSDQTFKFTLNNSSLELLWLPVLPEKRQWARPMVGGTIKSASEGFAGLMMLLLARVLAVQYLSLISLAAILGWIVAVIRLRFLYVQALASAIERHQIDFKELTLDAQDPAMVATIDRELLGVDEIGRLFALDLLEGMQLAPWTRTLRQLLEEGSADVKRKVLSLTARKPAVIPDELIVQAISAADLATPEAIRVARDRRLNPERAKLHELLDHGQPEIRAASAESILLSGGEHIDRARKSLLDLLDGKDENSRVAALSCLKFHEDLLPPAKLMTMLNDESIAVRETALAVAAFRGDDSQIGAVTPCIVDPRTRPAARKALRTFPAPKVVPELIRAYEDPRPDHAGRAPLVRSLEDFPTSQSVETLLQALQHWDLETVNQSAGALLTLAREKRLADSVGDRVKALSQRILRKAYSWNRILKLLPAGPESMLIRDDLEENIFVSLPALLRLKALKIPQTPVETVIQIVRAGDHSRLPFALELLDNILPGEDRDAVVGLLENHSVEELDKIGARMVGDLPANLDSAVLRMLKSPRIWASAVAMDYLMRTKRTDLLDSVDWNSVPDSDLRRELQMAKEQSSPMYSTLEKTILLKSVSLFQGVRAEKLARIAQVAEVNHCQAGDFIIREGELGDALFIVVAGLVRIETGGTKLAALKKGDCLGEMSLLDLAPRSADAVAEEDTTLLKVSQEDFYEVMSANPEITQAIMRILTRRLREANEKLRK